MNDHAIKQLAAATMLRAVKDYFGKKSTPKRRTQILKDLRSAWMRFFTDGMSVNIAEELEKNPEEIRERLRNHAKEELAV